MAALVLAAGCGSAPEPAPERGRQTVEDLTLSQSENGRPSWTLRSRLAVLREDEKIADLEAPTMDFYRDERAVSRVRALSGLARTDTHDIKLSSAVVLDSFDDRSELTTDDLFYSSKTKRFHTDDPVVIRRPEGTLRGVGLEATPDLSEIRIFRQTSTLSGARR